MIPLPLVPLLVACGPGPEPPAPVEAPPPPPSAWTLVQPSPTPARLYDVARGAEALFVVGAGGVLLRGDGTRWELRPVPTEADLHAVAATGSAVYAAGDDGTLLRSLDGGTSWELLPTGTKVDLVALAAEGAELLVGGEGFYAESADRGETWRPAGDGPSHVRDLAVTAHDRLLLTGDGLLRRAETWASVWQPPDGFSADALAVADDRAWILASRHTTAPSEPNVLVVGLRRLDDGAWVQARSGLLRARFLPRAIAPGAWITLAGGGHESFRSVDGETWEPSSGLAELRNANALDPAGLLALPDGAFGGGVLGVGASGSIVRSDDGGATWSWAVPGGPRGQAAGGTLAPDGAVWTAIPGAVVRNDEAGAEARILSPCCFDVLATPDALLAGGAGALWRSTDGERWTRVHDDAPRSPGYFDLFAAGGAYYAAGPELLRSTDGVRWARVWTSEAGTGPFPPAIRSMAAAGGRLYAVGDAGLLLEGDGERFTVREPPVEGVLAGVTAWEDGGAQVVAVGFGGVVAVSDGRSWTRVESGTSADLHAVWHDAATASLVAVGNEGVALLSRDGGRHWEPVPTHQASPLTDVFGDGQGTILAVGEDGVVLSLTVGE